MKYYVLFFILVMMIFATSQGQCEKREDYSDYGYIFWQADAPSDGQSENWKDYFKESDVIWQYDKDSIHYPEQKKNIFGITVQDKNIVNVLIRWKMITTEESGEGVIQRFYCAERKCLGCRREFIITAPNINSVAGDPGDIAPGSRWESLLKEVCP